MTNASALTAEQQEEAEQDILDDLKLFDWRHDDGKFQDRYYNWRQNAVISRQYYNQQYKAQQNGWNHHSVAVSYTVASREFVNIIKLRENKTHANIDPRFFWKKCKKDLTNKQKCAAATVR